MLLCPKCHGNSVLRIPGGIKECDRCEGSGEVCGKCDRNRAEIARLREENERGKKWRQTERELLDEIKRLRSLLSDARRIDAPQVATKARIEELQRWQKKLADAINDAEILGSAADDALAEIHPVLDRMVDRIRELRGEG